MPATIGYRRRILAVGLIAAGALYLFGAPLYVNRIEDDLAQRVPEELAEAGFTGVTAEFDGQDGTLRCEQAARRPGTGDGAGLRRVGRARHHARPLLSRQPTRRRQATVTRAAPSRRSRPSGGVQAVAAPATNDVIVYPTIGELIDTDPRLSYFSMLLSEAGLSEAIRVTGPLTVFAPTDEAFDELSADTNARLRSDPKLLSHLLGHHVANGLYLAADLRSEPVMMVDGHVLHARTDGTTILVQGVAIVEPDLRAGNGVVHVVNHLLMPGELDLLRRGAP